MADASRRLEVRESRKSTVLGTCAGWLMRLWCGTLRYEIEDRAGVTDRAKFPGPVIFCLWHNRIFYAPDGWRRLIRSFRPKLVVLTSASHDGAALARAMGVLGMGAVRGSSSRRAVAALVGMKKALREGNDLCLTPDGPRGPRYELQPGPVKLAESTGAPVVPVHAFAFSTWRLKSWDRFEIPKPFSRVRVIFDRALVVPPGLADDAFEAERAKLEAVMRAGTEFSYHSDPEP
jgi:lysophospholipid acyltransferase (LPLAT)-like uncharacterized protein